MEHQQSWVSASLCNRENIAPFTGASAWKPRGTKGLEAAGDEGGLDGREQSSRDMGWPLGKEQSRQGELLAGAWPGVGGSADCRRLGAQGDKDRGDTGGGDRHEDEEMASRAQGWGQERGTVECRGQRLQKVKGVQ